MCRASSTAIFDHVSERYDVIIVGSGAGGGTLAHTLAPSGKRILLLERGNFLPREIENWDPGPVFVDGPTRSTTCTSSTRVSSRASEP